MKKIILFLVIISVGPFGLADWVDHPIGLAVWIPEEWRQEADESLLQVTSPDDAVTVFYLMIDAENLEAAVEKLEIELSRIIKRVDIVREIEEVRVNGIPGVLTGGTGFVPGRIRDVKVRWLVGLLQYRDRALMVVGFAAEAVFDEHEGALVEMLTSIKNLWIQHPIGLEVWIHPEWLMETDKDSLIFSSPDGEVLIDYQIINAQKLTNALNLMEVNLKKNLSSIDVVQEPEEFLINDLPGVITAGTGNLKGLIIEGEAVKWMVAILFYKDKALMIRGLASEEMFDVYEREIEQILTSIREVE